MSRDVKASAGKPAALNRTRAALRESGELFRLLVAAVTDYAIFMLDPEGRVLTWNAGAENIKGYKADEIIGQHFSRFYPQDAIQRAWPDRELKLAQAEGRFEDEGWRVRKDGSQFWANVIITAMRDETGNLLGFSKITRDLTERKQAEERMRQANVELDKRVEERTAELEEKNEALIDVDRRKDQFLAMLAHELRNPLAPIRNGLHILRLTKGDTSGVAEQAMEIIEKQTHHLTRLVDDLLDVSRITRGKIELRKENIELGVAMSRAVESVRPLAEARQHTLTVVPPPDRNMLAADPTRLEQVLVNLLTNAVKYTKPTGHISVTAEREGEELVIRVRDTGVGVSADLLPHIFDLFTQGHRTLDRSEGGLGIGLTTVKKLVELHGGSVEAHSPGANQGSEFIVRLPALPAAPSKAGSVPSIEQADRGPRILIVEDVPDVAQVLVMLLKVWGYESRVAYDGPTGLVAFRTYQPDVVLCDIGLPGMSRYDVAQMMRKERRQTRPLLVAVTGYGAEEDKKRSHEAGFDVHLTKPPDPVALGKLLTGFIQPGLASA